MPFPSLSKNSLSLLKNLQDIYVEANDGKATTVDLVPSLFGQRLYSSTTGLSGRIYKLVYVVLKFFLGDTFVQIKLSKAIQATHQAFFQLDEFRKNYHDSVYQNYLDHKSFNQPQQYSLKEIHHARHQIEGFYQATFPFIKQVSEKKNLKLNSFLENNFSDLYRQSKQPFNSETFEKVKGYVSIMRLEHLANGELPLHAFRLLSKENDVPLDVNDRRELASFIKKMEKIKNKNCFQVNQLHAGLKSIIRNFKANNVESSDVKILEKKLIREGCPLLDEFDPSHVCWREGLKIGDRCITENDPFYFLSDDLTRREFVLGNQLNGVKKEVDHYKVYEVHDSFTGQRYDDLLMITGPNKICLDFKNLLRTESFWGLETPKIHYIHPKGRYAIIEKLPKGLESIEWYSIASGPLHELDKKYATAFRALIEFFIQEKNSPKNFKAENLRFIEGQLKSIKECIPCGYVDYIALEKVIYELSRKNLFIYQYLVETLRETQFSKNKLLPFFKEIISSAFEKYVTPVDRLAKRRRIKDKAIIARAEELQSFVKHLKEDLTKHYPQKLDRAKMRESVLKVYERDKTLGRFWDINVANLTAQIEKDQNI